MRWNTGVLAGLLIGLAWLVLGIVTYVIGRRNGRRSKREGAGGAAIIGIFLIVVAVLTLFATLLLAVVPGND
jgi:heme/copper-type cytochrome/quinol oxidase subunit 2